MTEFTGDNDWIEQGVLADENGHYYPIVDGIPRFLTWPFRRFAAWASRWRDYIPAEACEFTGASESQDPGTVSSFGFEWSWDSRPRSDKDVRYRVLEKCQLDKEFFKGRIVLDAGCGAGMQAAFMAGLGATVVAMDLSDAVSAAQENLKHYDSLVLQGDIMCPPLAAETFDLVYSEGVLHHTTDPKKAFCRLVNLVKPGGYIAAGFYGKREKGPTPFLLLRQPLRAIVSRLPARVVWVITGISPLLNAIPLLNYILRKTVLLYDPRNPGWKSTWCLNYDFYGPHTYQHYLRPSEVRELWMKPSLGLVDVLETAPGFHRARKFVRRDTTVCLNDA